VCRPRVSYLMHGIDFNQAAAPMQAMQAKDGHAAQRGRLRRILVGMFQSRLGDAPDAPPKPGRLPEDVTKATSADALSSAKAAFGVKLTLLLAVICVVAMLVTFAAVAFVSAWSGFDCRSPRRSISIGNVVLVAGCPRNGSPGRFSAIKFRISPRFRSASARSA
jgi:hypothetical protein